MVKLTKKVNNFIQARKAEEKVYYEDLNEIDELTTEVQETVSQFRQKVDIDIFFKDGYVLDIEKIKERFKAKKLKKKFPNFNFKRLGELYREPPKTIKTYYDDQEILIDDYVFRKYVIGIIQMVLDHMDLVTVVTGGEGTGKSTHVSQMMYMVYWIIRELGIADYKFEINDCFFNSLEKLRLKEDDLFEERFRILTLDEGNELHRQNWKDEEVATFFQRLRRERFNQRIKFICIPVLGELITNIVLSRVNFIVDMSNTNDGKTGGLNKGRANFYIIPRGDKIYSPAQKKDLTRGEIKTHLYENLKDKSYLKGMPAEILALTYRCNGVWGFPEDLYIKELKDTNKTFKVAGGLKLTDTEAFYLYKLGINLKVLGLTTKDVTYATLNKFLNRLKRYFEDDIDRFNKYNLVLERKEKEREVKLGVKNGLNL